MLPNRCQTVFALVFISAGLSAASLVAIAGDPVDGIVSQKGRKFNPGEASVLLGHALVVVNDDGDLLHHAYVESDDFNFDSGDQQPGSHTPIVFTHRGDYTVLCGIHPKMRLRVHVR